MDQFTNMYKKFMNDSLILLQDDNEERGMGFRQLTELIRQWCEHNSRYVPHVDIDGDVAVFDILQDLGLKRSKTTGLWLCLQKTYCKVSLSDRCLSIMNTISMILVFTHLRR